MMSEASVRLGECVSSVQSGSGKAAATDLERRLTPLVRNAYQRVRSGGPEVLSEWNEAVGLLTGADRFLLKAIKRAGGDGAPASSGWLQKVLARYAVVAGLLCLLYLADISGVLEMPRTKPAMFRDAAIIVIVGYFLSRVLVGRETTHAVLDRLIGLLGGTGRAGGL